METVMKLLLTVATDRPLDLCDEKSKLVCNAYYSTRSPDKRLLNTDRFEFYVPRLYCYNTIR